MVLGLSLVTFQHGGGKEQSRGVDGKERPFVC